MLPIVDPDLQALVDSDGDDGYRIYLESLRWPDGAACPRCDSTKLLWLDSRSKYHCYSCRYQFRVTAGTLFHSSHVPLSTWLHAVALFLSAERGYPATELQRSIGSSYKTAWYVEHRIRAALAGGTGQARRPSFATFTHLIAGAHRNLSIKYISAYWNEATWRTAKQESSHIFRDTVIELLRHPPLPYRQLIAAGAAA
jgi:transposase-like protein